MREAVKYLLLLVMSIMSASCVFDADSCIVSDDKRYDVMFTVSLSGPQTRATWEDVYDKEAGVPFDFRIMPDKLRLEIIHQGGERLGVIDDLDYWPLNEAHTEFQFMGKMPKEFLNHFRENGKSVFHYRFMVFANCADNASGEEYITYSHAQLDPSLETSAIPMWGVQQVKVTPLSKYGSLNLGDISLLRAAAKVEVKLCDKLKKEGITINSATLKYYNQTGYVLPNGWSDVAETKKLDQENCHRVYRHAAVNLPLIKGDNGDYYTYVTEYDNINYSGERNKISLEFTIGGETKYFEDAISFCEYVDGAPVEDSHYNIVRNHIYEFEVLSIAGSSLTLDYTVADWTTEDWGNGEEYEEHDLSYPTYHNPVVPYEFLGLTSTEQSSYVITQEPTMHYSAGNLEDGGFHCYFQILAPNDVQWKPSFTASKENYQLRVYKVYKEDNKLIQSNAIFDSGVDGKQGNIGACEAGEWYHIVIFPLSDDGADKTEIEFGISYYQMWTDQYINLYVNGEYGKIRWPNSGNNPKIINIRHTSAQ